MMKILAPSAMSNQRIDRFFHILNINSACSNYNYIRTDISDYFYILSQVFIWNFIKLNPINSYFEKFNCFLYIFNLNDIFFSQYFILMLSQHDDDPHHIHLFLHNF